MTDTAWEAAWRNAQPHLSSIRDALAVRNHSGHRIFRVGQLDSELLDQELAQILQEPINKALSLINSSLKTQFEPEWSLLIHLVLYKLSIWSSGASYGAKLQDLRYITPVSKLPLTPSGLPRKTLLAHATLTLIFPYLHSRFRAHSLSQAWPDAPSSDRRRKLWDLLNSVESAHGLFGVINFIAFLWNGRYRTIADRLLKMRLVPSRRIVRRDVSYEFMNRQMVWHAFTEFLLFLLPLINARTARRRFYRLASYISPLTIKGRLPSIFRPLLTEGTTAVRKRKAERYASLPAEQCAICAENASFNFDLSQPTNVFTALATVSDSSSDLPETELPPYPINTPYITACGHLYCYHCIAERIIHAADEADDESYWLCLRCGEEVRKADRFRVDIQGSDASGSDYDFSSDLDMDVTDMSGSMGSYSESVLSE